MIIGRHLRISGRVQGVFFRQWTVEQARDLGVSGWVRNCPNGTVEAHVEGDEEAVRRLFQRMTKGPSNARVESVFAEPSELEGCVSFEVRH